jgi:hypothetical protein
MFLREQYERLCGVNRYFDTHDTSLSPHSRACGGAADAAVCEGLFAHFCGLFVASGLLEDRDETIVGGQTLRLDSDGHAELLAVLDAQTFCLVLSVILHRDPVVENDERKECSSRHFQEEPFADSRSQ